jgi:hypothetical protein
MQQVNVLILRRKKQGKRIEATCSRIRNNTGTTTNMYVEKVLEVGKKEGNMEGQALT